jgi:hypothetical protein
VSANPASLLTLARRLARECPDDLGLEIAVTGSVGAGLADEHSDLELLLLVDELPTVERVCGWLRSIGATDILAGPDPDGVWAWCRVDGVEVEPFWARVAETEAEVNAILAGETIEHARLAFAHVLSHCVVLRGQVLVRLAERCAVYPEALGRRLVEDSLSGLEIPAAPTASARRGDSIAVHGTVLNGTHKVLRTVFALNRRWEPPRWKWVAEYASELTVAPPRLVARLEATLSERDLVAAIRTLNELIRDTLVLLPPGPEVDAARHGTEARLAQLGP